MKPGFLTVMTLIGVLAFLALFMADREMQSGVERLSRFSFSPRSALEADPTLERARSGGRSGPPTQGLGRQEGKQ